MRRVPSGPSHEWSSCGAEWSSWGRAELSWRRAVLSEGAGQSMRYRTEPKGRKIAANARETGVSGGERRAAAP